MYLNPSQAQHAPIWFALLEEDRRFLERCSPHLKELKCLADAQRYIQEASKLDFYLGSNNYEIWTQGQLAGLISLHSASFLKNSVELGYWLGRAYRGKGLVLAASHYLISHTFVHFPNIQTVCIRCFTDNFASQTIAKQLGMQLINEKEQILCFEMPRMQWMQTQYEEDDLLSILDTEY